MKIKVLTTTIASIAAISSTAVQAADLNWSGFATIAAGMRTSGDDIPDGLKTPSSQGLLLYGYDDTPSVELGSHMGLQASANMGEGVTFVAQIIARGADEWQPTVEWAYIGYQATDHLKFIFGRQRIPFFAYSDFLDVSYAYHWITPPEEMYDSVPFDSANGIGIVYSNSIGVVDSRLHFLYGRNEQDISIGNAKQQSDINNIMSLSWTLDYDWLNFRAGYTSADVDFGYPGIDTLTGTWAGYGAATGNSEWANFSNYISTSDGNNTGDFTDAALTINRNGFLFVAEYGKLGTDGAITGDTEGMYATLGYQFGNFMPHLTYGTSEGTASSTDFLDGVRAQLGNGEITGLIDHDFNPDTPDIPANLAVGGLLAGTEAGFNGSISKEKYWSVGLKWDFHPSVSFKAEYKTLTNDLTNDSKSLIRFALVSVF